MSANPIVAGAEVKRPGFVTGLRCLFQGFGWLISHPPVWPIALIPIGVALLITTLLGAAAVEWVPPLVARLVGPTSSSLAGAGAFALKIVGTVLALILSLLIALGLAQPLSGPALERLAREQERALGAPERAPTAFWLDIVRSLESLLLGYACGLPALATLALVTLLLPFASVVSVPLKLVVTAFIIAWDLCDYPLSIRGLRVRRRLDLIFSYKGAVLGFGVGLAACGLVPCLLFLFLPAGVAAASRLMWEVERYEHTLGRELDGSPLRQPAPQPAQLRGGA